MGIKIGWLTPGRIIVLSMAVAISLGTAALLLPVAQKTPVSGIDCFFTAVSATCVTGILTIDVGAFTPFGRTIILLLVQIGGIGLVTLFLFVVSLFARLGMTTQLMVGQIYELQTWEHIRNMVLFIIGLTTAFELIGAWLIWMLMSNSITFFEALAHAVSSFCSAGFQNLGINMMHAQNHPALLAITGGLILAGGLGFFTWYELFSYLTSKIQKKRYTFSLTTKVVLWMTFFLITGATILLLALERTHFTSLPWWQHISNMIFNAISYRSTGLTTINPETMRTATIFLILMYSFIGSSPGSTGSGIKVTTFALFLGIIRSVITGKSYVEIESRQIPQDQIFKAMAVLSLSFGWIIFSTFLLSLIEQDIQFINIFWQTVASFTTLGMGSQITPCLTVAGKLIVALNMFIGRIGSLTILLALRTRTERTEFRYPEERIMIS